jgi:hypothetical protein
MVHHHNVQNKRLHKCGQRKTWPHTAGWVVYISTSEVLVARHIELTLFMEAGWQTLIFDKWGVKNRRMA